MTSSVSHRIIIIFSCPLDHLCRQESVREAAPRVPPDPALPPTREDAQCRFPHTSSRLTRSVFLLVITVTLQSARNRGAGRRATTHRSTPRAGYPRYPSRWSSVRCAGSAAPSRRPTAARACGRPAALSLRAHRSRTAGRGTRPVPPPERPSRGRMFSPRASGYTREHS